VIVVLPSRDLRVDFFRGLALLFIFVDHIPGNGFAKLTLTNFGFADAAEIFVLLAGYASILAYSKSFERSAVSGLIKVGMRIRDLYVAHILVLIACVIGLTVAERTFHNPFYFEHVNLIPFNVDPAGAIAGALLLIYQPGYLNILPLYMVLLLWLPVLILLIRVHVMLALSASAMLWSASSLLQFNLPKYPGSYGWIFNPFAWQLLFTLGAVTSYMAINARPLRLRSRSLFWLAAAYVLFALIVAAPWTQLPGLKHARLLPDFRIDLSKEYLSAWRLAHIFALAYVAVYLVPPGANWLSRPWARLIINCGQNSLPVFCLSIVLSVAVFVILVEAGDGLPLQIAVNLGGITLLGLAGWKLATLRRAGRQTVSAFTAIQNATATSPTCDTSRRNEGLRPLLNHEKQQFRGSPNKAPL
jgi:hypothetical protein